MSATNTTINTAAGAATVVDTSTTAAAAGGGAYALTTASSTTKDVIILNVAAASTANGDLSTATDGTQLLKALTSTAADDTYTGITTSAGTAEKCYFIANQGGKAYLYYADSAATTAGLFEPADILLIGTFTGTIASTDFAVMLT